MSLTLRAIDSISTEGNSPDWMFGGGTALAVDLQHRISYDIDAFMDSAKAIQALVPVRNEVTRSICWNEKTNQAEFHWPGHYLKLFVEGMGEIDFLGAATLLDNATVPFEFQGRLVKRERPAEVIAKKIYHRGTTFKARDIFDLAGTYLALPDELVAAARSPYITDKILERVRVRILTREATFREEIVEDTNPTAFGDSYRDDAIRLAYKALDFMERHVRPT